MRVTMLEDKTVTIDGVNTIDAEAGETYEMGDGIGQDLIDAGAAKADGADDAPPAKKRRGAKNKDAGPAEETQDAGAAEEHAANEEQA